MPFSTGCECTATFLVQPPYSGGRGTKGEGKLSPLTIGGFEMTTALFSPYTRQCHVFLQFCITAFFNAPNERRQPGDDIPRQQAPFPGFLHRRIGRTRMQPDRGAGGGHGGQPLG